MAITTKPTSYTVNTGHAKCPDHLYMLDDSTGGTTVNDSVGSLDLTADSTTMWTTDGSGSSFGQILRFAAASSRNAMSAAGLSASTGLCMVCLFRPDGASNLSVRVPFGTGHLTTSGIYGGIRFNSVDTPQAVIDTGGITNVNNTATDIWDDDWHLVAVKFNQSTGSDGVLGISIDGGAWDISTTTGDQDLTQINALSLGSTVQPTPVGYFDGDVLAAYVYLNDYSAWDDAWIASIYSDPWQFLSTATTYVKLLTEASAASEASVEGVVLNATRDTVIGEFSGQTFEATLESGEAVLLIDVADITPNGSTLTTSDTPIVFAYNATYSTVGPGSATVVEI